MVALTWKLILTKVHKDHGVQTGPVPGVSLSAIGFLWEIHEKKFFSETTRAKAFIFGRQHCYVELYINLANHAPGVKKMAPPWESIAPIDLQLEEHKKNLLLRNHTAQSFHILCVALYSTVLLFINPANCAPGVHTGHAPGASLSTLNL